MNACQSIDCTCVCRHLCVCVPVRVCHSSDGSWNFSCRTSGGQKWRFVSILQTSSYTLRCSSTHFLNKGIGQIFRINIKRFWNVNVLRGLVFAFHDVRSCRPQINGQVKKYLTNIPNTKHVISNKLTKGQIKN